MPAGLWRLTDLETIDFDERGLSGTLPIEYSMLSFLNEFDLQKAKISGTLPGAFIASLVRPRKLQFEELDQLRRAASDRPLAATPPAPTARPLVRAQRHAARRRPVDRCAARPDGP